MTSTQYKGLSPDRVCNPTDVNFLDLECPICHDILWKPVACQQCETPFCSPCIHHWLKTESKCPSGCKAFTERKCPPFIAKLLARLQVNCFYQVKGCNQPFAYEALEKHELECVYQVTQCPGCETSVMKKDLANHKRTCASIKVTCKECRMMFKRGDFSKKHTSNACFREQIRHLRAEAEENKHKLQLLTCQINDLLIWKNRISHEKVIGFDDLPMVIDETRWIPPIYKGLKWSKIVYMARSYAAEAYPSSGYTAAFVAGGNRHIAFFNEEASVSNENAGETFHVISLTACSAWNENLHLTVLGYRDSVQVNTFSSVLLFGKPQILSLQWQNIDKLVLQPMGDAAPAENQDAASDTHCILTQLIVNEPSFFGFDTFD